MARRNTCKLAILIAITITLTAVPSALAQNSGVADEAVVDFTLTADDSATVTIEQRWDGENAKGMRQSLDVFFGAGDGTLAPGEVEDIADASEKDIQGQALPLFTYDDAPVKVRSVDITIHNASGLVTSTDTVRMSHKLELELKPAAGDNHTLTVSPFWDGRIDVHAPEGVIIVHESGLGSPTGTETRDLGGSLAARTNATLTFAPAPEQTGGSGLAEDPEESTGAAPGKTPNTVPGPGIVLVAAGLGIALLLARRNRA